MSGRPQDKPRTGVWTSAGNAADRRALTGEGSEGTTKPSFLPTVTRGVRPIVHKSNTTLTGSLCGAPVLGILTSDDLECVVCAEILEGRKVTTQENTKPRKRSLLDKLRRRH